MISALSWHEAQTTFAAMFTLWYESLPPVSYLLINYLSSEHLTLKSLVQHHLQSYPHWAHLVSFVRTRLIDYI